jgi:hypothetical protein
MVRSSVPARARGRNLDCTIDLVERSINPVAAGVR